MPDTESKWKSTPVTVGLLISLAGGIYYGAGYISDREQGAVEEAIHALSAQHDQQITNLRVENLIAAQQYERERTNRIVTRIETDLKSLYDNVRTHIEEYDERIDELERTGTE